METKTIEERADAYAERMCEASADKYCYAVGYYNGATEQDKIARKEQREIDIQRAVEIYEHELKEIVEVINKFSRNKVGDVISIEGSVKDFEKIMKGENYDN